MSFLVASVVTVGAIGVGTAAAIGKPSIANPPPPPNSTVYDDEGRVMSKQTYDKKTNTWTTTGKELTAEEKADREKAKQIRSTMLDNLNETPADRVQAYEQYGKAYSDSAHKDTDARFAEFDRSTDEKMNARGMFGSRAYVDLKSELAKDKLAEDTSIATQATMAKEDLASNDRTFWANMLQQIEAGTRADTLVQLQANKSMSDASSNNYAGTLGYYNAVNSGNIAKWQARKDNINAMSDSLSGTAGGLMYLYGQGKFGNKAA